MHTTSVISKGNYIINEKFIELGRLFLNDLSSYVLEIKL